MHIICRVTLGALSTKRMSWMLNLMSWENSRKATDFDGNIDPLENYHTALQFEGLEKDLI
jgi:hypothetical protein